MTQMLLLEKDFWKRKSFQLLAQLERVRTGELSPVVFVAHSMGVLIVKHMLIESSKNKAYTKLFEATCGVIFFGTPHAESKLPILAPLLTAEESMEEIYHICDRDRILELDKTFRTKVVRDEMIRVACFGESLPTPGVNEIVVDKQASRPPYGTWLSVQSDHLTLCNFGNSMDSIYQHTLKFIIDCALEYEKKKSLVPVQIPEKEGHYVEIDMIKKDKEAPNKNIGFAGPISREETMQRLTGKPIGGFLIRWSEHTKSYVLSFVGQNRVINHIAHIKPIGSEGALEAVSSGGTERYADMNHFVTKMRQAGLIDQPFPEDDVKSEKT